MPAGIVRDDSVGDAMLAELPRGQAHALIPWPRLINPDMNRHAAVMRLVNRRQCRAPVDRCKPACVAMGEHIERILAGFFRGGVAQDFQAVIADGGIDCDVFLADFRGAPVRRFDALLAPAIAKMGPHNIECPAQIHRGRTARQQHIVSAIERLIRCVGRHCQANAVGGRSADERRAAHLHGFDRGHRGSQIAQIDDLEPVRQQGLINNPDRSAVVREPDCAVEFSVHAHGVVIPETALCGISPPKRHRPYSLSRPRAGPSSLLLLPPAPTEGARDARGPIGPAGLDASRHRGLSKSLCLTFRSGSSDQQSVPQVRQTQGVPRAVFIGLLPSKPRWSLLIRVCPLGLHRDMSTERDPDRAGPLLTGAGQTTVASGVPGAQQARSGLLAAWAAGPPHRISDARS